MQTSFVTVFAGSIANQPEQLCNARDLHAALKVGRDFSTWIKERLTEYGFEENQDYIIFPQNGGKLKQGRGRPTKDYHLTLDTAKELAMVEKTEVGRQIRRYFIQCEKELRQTVSHSLPDPYRSRPVAGGLNAEQISVVKAFHRQLVQCAPKEQQARLAVTLWSGIKRKFGTAYKNIAPEYYPEILSLMGRIAVHKGAAPFYMEGAPFANTQSISFDGSQDAKYLIEIKDGKIISSHELTVSRSCVPTPC